MIVHASGRFVCLHTYIAVADDDGARFVCDRCGHRTVLLPLQRSSAFGRVLRFSRAWPGFPFAAPFSGCVTTSEDTHR